jgi:hypothetical protein
VFENRLLRVFGQKRDEVTGREEKLHNEKFRICTSYQYCSGDQIKTNEMVGVLTRTGERNGVVGIRERKRSLGRPSCRGGLILRWMFRK